MAAQGESIRYYVYVVELDKSKRKTEKPAVYVGQSAKTPPERFAQHKRGVRASRHVRDHGVRLRPRLYEKHNPLESRQDAEAKETWLAERLRKRGYTVYGGH